MRRWALVGGIVVLVLGSAAGCGGAGGIPSGSGQRYAATFCERGELSGNAALVDLIFTDPAGWATAVGNGTPMVATDYKIGTWHLTHLPAPRGHTSYVYSLAGTGAVPVDDLWAVGAEYPGGSTGHSLALVEHYDGKAWSIVPTPPLHVQAAVLHAIAYGSRNSAWAVGGYGNRQGGSFPLHALVEHWDGHKWSVMSSPDPGVTQNGLIDAIAESPDAFWTLAALDSGDVVVEHWDGRSWHTYRLKGFTSYTATMTLTGSDDVWVVGQGRHGEQYDLGSERVRYMHWDGDTWSVIPSPKVDGRAQIHAVVPSSPLDVWAVGDIESTDPSKGIQPLVEHWDGTKWSVAPSPTFKIPPAEGEMDPISASASLFGVAIQSGGRPWAVGQKPAGHGADQQPLIEAACHPA
jgi:hypothetical protein